MLALSVSMTFAPDDLPRVKEFVRELSVLSRKDAGCVEYWWAESLEAPDTLRLYEVWESMGSLQEHLAQPHEIVWKSEYQPLVLDIEVIRYDPSTKGTL